MAEELDAPLKGKKKPRRAGRLSGGWNRFRRLPLTRIILGVLFLMILGIAGRILLVDDPQGGRPSAEIGISREIGTNPLANDVANESPIGVPVQSSTTETSEGGPSITIVGDDVPDEATGSNMNVAALTEFGVLPDLVEETQNGPIPRIGPQGETAFDAYARASVTQASADERPMVAIIITGLGISESSTISAIEKLPDNVTLAFAPYGSSLRSTSAMARAGGHEMLLQIPLEPFDYPDNDPGPQTLLTGQPPRANLDKLFWLMARTGGYTAVINHMGARFTSSAADLSPVMEEIGARGLGYVDDGSSNRSVAANLARTNRVPFRRADIEIDGIPARAEILENLEALERRATEKGMAVGIASGLPITVQMISEWTDTLEEKGILLVPASALMTRP